MSGMDTSASDTASTGAYEEQAGLKWGNERAVFDDAAIVCRLMGQWKLARDRRSLFIDTLILR
jgi:hypothetical protein